MSENPPELLSHLDPVYGQIDVDDYSDSLKVRPDGMEVVDDVLSPSSSADDDDDNNNTDNDSPVQ